MGRDLPTSDRTAAIDYLRSQLTQLEEVGFMPVVPKGGPPGAGEYRAYRHGPGQAAARPPAVDPAPGDRLNGDAGDWRVMDDGGDERTVRDPEFQASHEPLGGEVLACASGPSRPGGSAEQSVLRTMEGRAVAQPGDWVVEGSGGERWPVPNGQFERGYLPWPARDQP